MTVVEPCRECEGKGTVPAQYGTQECPMCQGKGYRTSSDAAPPVIPRKSDGKLPPVQLELPV